jgi:asparagine synthase (glutamine-hydrolysing)
MCSVSGFYVLRDDHPRADFADVAFGLMRHRGPDAERAAYYDDGRVCLAHQRLSIIDVSDRANQPMERDGTALAYNGEIYNYLELRRERLAHESFSTDSDTEVLHAGLRHEGLRFLNRANGMFAFAYYDARTRALWLARDRYGVKPLHYLVQDGVLYFASEIRPLVAIKRDPAPNLPIYRRFMRDTATDYDDQTFVDGIFQVRKGHALVCVDGTIGQQPWYFGRDFQVDETAFADRRATVEHFEALLTDAIDKRLRSDAPVCLTLSGGLDSTTIYTLIKERLRRPITAFVFGHPGAVTDETAKVEALVRPYGDDVRRVLVDPARAAETISEALTALEFPIWNCAGVAYLETYRAIAAAGFRVVVEGHGSDEQLGGYGFMIQARFNELLRRGRWIEAWTIAGVLAATGNPELGQGRSRGAVIREGLRQLPRPRGKSNDFGLAVDDAFNYRILPIVLRAFDRLSMHSAVESRSPFLDYRVVEFLAAMPTRAKVGAIGSKAILREILKKYGKGFIYEDQRKTGFGADVPRLLSCPATIDYLTAQARAFDMAPFNAERDRTLAALEHRPPDRQRFNWKIPSLGFVNSAYRLRPRRRALHGAVLAARPTVTQP